jgi:hypothetical protein
VLSAYRSLLNEGKRKQEVETQITELVKQTGFKHFLLIME